MYKLFDRVDIHRRSKRIASANTMHETKSVETRPAGTGVHVSFADGLLENSHLKQPRKFVDLLISFVSQAAFVILLILLPLCYTQALSLPEFERTILVVPPPPPAPPKVEMRVAVKPKASLFENGKLMAPRVIPKRVEILKEAPAESATDSGVPGGVLGGVPGGAVGGALGGILSSGNPPVPPPPKPVRSSGPFKVGGRIQAPRLIHRVEPDYPVLAKATRTEGAVVLDCVINEHGTVTEMKLVSGNPLLIEAAMRAVQQWKFQPTLLNGNPIPVEMHVTVTFLLGNS